MLKIQFAKKIDTTVQIVQKGLKPESEKKEKIRLFNRRASFRKCIKP